MAGVSGENAADDTADAALMMPAVTEQEKALGAKATEDFGKKEYDASLLSLDKLLASRPNDPKILHNKAVAEYYLSGLRNYDAFTQSLAKVAAMARVNINDIEIPDDVDQCVVYYNQAIMFYHTKRYAESLAIIEALYQFLELVAEEPLSKRMLCLLVEVYLCMHQPEKALDLIAEGEKVMLQNMKAAMDKDSLTSSNNKDTKDSKEEDAAAAEAWRLKMVLYKIQSFLACKNVKLCKRELKSLGSTSNPTAVYMKANYEYLRGNAHKAMRLLNSAAPAAAGGARAVTDVASSLHYNNLGCVHAQLRKHNLASFYFKKAVLENEVLARDLRLDSIGHSPSGRPLYSLAASRHYELLHNAGVQLLHCGRPLPAFDCLIEAVKVYSSNPRLWLRIAECCVMAQRKNNDEDRSLESRRCVIESVVGSGIHRKIILGSGKTEARMTMESAAMPAATLQFASLCLQNALHLLATAAAASSEAVTTAAGGTAAPLHASEQLQAAAESGISDSSSTSGGGGVAGTNQTSSSSLLSSQSTAGRGGPASGLRLPDHRHLTPAPPSTPMKASEVNQLKCSVLANSAYVALCLGDHLQALRHAESLLAMGSISPAHKYLGQMYAAEANVRLDMIAEAIQKLVPESVTDIGLLPLTTLADGTTNSKLPTFAVITATASAGMAEHEVSPSAWIPSDVTKARAIMQYNLAVCYAIRGELDKALAALTLCLQGIGSPPPAQVYSLRLYLNLIEGKRKAAHGIIKEHFGHVTPNRL